MTTGIAMGVTVGWTAGNALLWWARWRKLMSPSFRDLKGREVEEVVDSRAVTPTATSVPSPADTSEVRAAVSKLLQTKRSRAGDPYPDDPDRDHPLPDLQAVDRRMAGVTLPADVETALDALEAHLAVVQEHARVLIDAVAETQQAAEAIRARAQADVEKLAKVDAALKVLQG